VHDAAAEMVKAARSSGASSRPSGTTSTARGWARSSSRSAPTATTLDGLNPHGNIVDELHAHKDRGLWDVLDTAMGARRQPITIAITTAGIYEPESIGWQMHDHAVEGARGDRSRTRRSSRSSRAAEDDDWTEPDTGRRRTRTRRLDQAGDYLEGAVREGEAAAVVPQHVPAAPPQPLDPAARPVDHDRALERLRRSRARQLLEREAALKGALCYGGLDLSTKLDISALVLVFPETWDLLCRFWIPKENIARAR
jgi:hypothetical protein